MIVCLKIESGCGEINLNFEEMLVSGKRLDYNSNKMMN